MADIFISYSSYNREKANALVKELRAAGHDVWMDQGGIGGAMDWSSEIVEALNKAKTVLFLISKDSVTSHNCAKEIHLANEKHKNILPVVIEDTPLPVLFEYPLAGLQRVPYERTDAILDALEALKGGKSVLEAMLTQSKIDDGGIYLAVLPFEDQSPTQDNEWLASGMTDELIGTLGSLSKMKVNPKGDVIYYKKNRPKLEDIAQDLKVRYIVEGAVQKVGERIRIKVSLTDCKLHEQIWHEKYDGTFDDIFDFQDRTCYSIAEAIKLKLTADDINRIEKKPTENADAYELLLRSLNQIDRNSPESFLAGISLAEEAIKLDPNFSWAYGQVASICRRMYEMYSRDEKWIVRAMNAVQEMENVAGEHPNLYFIKAGVALASNKMKEAYALAKRSIELNPKFESAYDTLSFACLGLGKVEEAAEARRQALVYDNKSKTLHFNYIAVLDQLGDTERRRIAASEAIPVFERYIRFNPDDYQAKSQLCYVLISAGKNDEAQNVVQLLLQNDALPGLSLYNIACTQVKLADKSGALQTLSKSIQRGFIAIEAYREDPDLDPLRGMPEFAELMEELEEKIAKEKNG